MASRDMKWIQQYGASEKKDEELKYYLSESHQLVSLGLTKKKKKEKRNWAKSGITMEMYAEK